MRAVREGQRRVSEDHQPGLSQDRSLLRTQEIRLQEGLIDRTIKLRNQSIIPHLSLE